MNVTGYLVSFNFVCWGRGEEVMSKVGGVEVALVDEANQRVFRAMQRWAASHV